MVAGAIGTIATTGMFAIYPNKRIIANESHDTAE
jgi:hypothetical protein